MELFLVHFFFSSRRRHTRFDCDWSSDVCSSDLLNEMDLGLGVGPQDRSTLTLHSVYEPAGLGPRQLPRSWVDGRLGILDRSEERRVGKECGYGGWRVV